MEERQQAPPRKEKIDPRFTELSGIRGCEGTCHIGDIVQIEGQHFSIEKALMYALDEHNMNIPLCMGCYFASQMKYCPKDKVGPCRRLDENDHSCWSIYTRVNLDQKEDLAPNKKYLIWWLSQQDQEQIAEERQDGNIGFPKYIEDELDSMYGRAGRGRLWISNECEDESFEVYPWPDNEMGKICGNCSGLVFVEEDLLVLEDLPGMVTDRELNII